MSTWLLEDPTTAYVVLGLAAFALGVGWWMQPRRGYLIGLGVVIALIGLVALLNLMVDTDAKRIQRKIQAMAAAVAGRDVEGIFRHISADFRLRGMDRNQFRQRVEAYIHRGDVQSLTVWEYQPRNISREQRVATVTFSVKGHGQATSGVEFYNCKAQFVLDADGEWRLRGFDLFLPQVDPMTGQPIDLPF
jgi:hypothetical protein